jgi:hypothetical protein
MLKASSFKKINEIEIGTNKEKILITIEQAYKKAPYYSSVLPLINDIIKFESKNLALFIANSLVKISDFCQIKTEIVFSSEIEKDNELKAQEKVISICKLLEATEYYNAIGGQELYDKSTFADNNIDLKFLQTKIVEYQQFNNEFIPHLSILDVMMFNSVDKINQILDNYELT